jgi:hypothetical protein
MEAVELKVISYYEKEFDEAITYLFNQLGLDNPIVGVNGTPIGFEHITCMVTEYDYKAEKNINVETDLLGIYTYNSNPDRQCFCLVCCYENRDGTYSLSYNYKKNNEEDTNQDTLAFYQRDLVRELVKTVEIVKLANQLELNLNINNKEQKKRTKL